MLPDSTFFGSIHWRINGALKMLYKVDRIGERSYDAISARTMNTVENLILETFRSLFAAPNICVREEEYLLGGVLFQTGQSLFRTVRGDVILIGPKGFSKTTIVCYVFPLCVSAVYVKSIGSLEFRYGVIAILIYDALLPFVKFS